MFVLFLAYLQYCNERVYFTWVAESAMSSWSDIKALEEDRKLLNYYRRRNGYRFQGRIAQYMILLSVYIYFSLVEFSFLPTLFRKLVNEARDFILKYVNSKHRKEIQFAHVFSPVSMIRWRHRQLRTRCIS